MAKKKPGRGQQLLQLALYPLNWLEERTSIPGHVQSPSLAKRTRAGTATGSGWRRGGDGDLGGVGFEAGGELGDELTVGGEEANRLVVEGLREFMAGK